MTRLWILLAALILGSATLAQAQDPDHAHGEGHPEGHQVGHEKGHGHEHGHGAKAGHHGDHQHHKGVHHDFSDADRWFRIFEGEERDEFQKPDHVVALMELQPGMTVADVGAGTGYFLPYLSAAVGPDGRVLGLDPEANLVHFMQERGKKEGWTNVEARQIPLDTPNLEASSANRILLVNTWHHIDDRDRYSAKLQQALAPGGRVIVVDYTKESPRGPSVEHRLPAQRVVEELEAGGLEAKVLEEDLPWQYVVVASKPE